VPDEFSVILYCDYCLNPVTMHIHTDDSILTRPYIWWQGRYLCMVCATTVAGFSIDLRMQVPRKVILWRN
jgi:hypothetical protein